MPSGKYKHISSKHRSDSPKRGKKTTFPKAFYIAIKKSGKSNSDLCRDMGITIGRLNGLITGAVALGTKEYDYFTDLCSEVNHRKRIEG